MKKLVIIFIFLIEFCPAQNWFPIISSNQYTYFSSVNFSSVSEIKTDSLTFLGADSTFYLNRIVKPIPLSSNKGLKNQGQFLQKYVVSRANGYVTFKGDSSFTLKINANLSDVWLFDSVLNLTATVVILKKDSVLGQLDSVKVIRVSNSDTIILSKNFGISYFKKTAANIYYKLKGIQNLNMGFHVPGFKDFYNFNIGDVFEYRIVEGHSSTTVYNTYSQYRHYQLTILSKSVSGSTISYIAQKNSADTIWTGYMQPYNIVLQTTTTTLVYTDSVKAFSNNFNHQLCSPIKCSANPWSYTGELSFDKSSLFNVLLKKYDPVDLQPYSGDTLSLNGSSSCNKAQSFGNGLGFTYAHSYEYCGMCSYYSDTYLIGCIKTGTQYGYISSAPFGIKEPEKNNSLSVFPTIFSDDLNILGTNETCHVTINDVLGRVVYSNDLFLQDDKPISINLSFLERGNYILKISGNSNNIFVKKVIKIDQ